MEPSLDMCFKCAGGHLCLSICWWFNKWVNKMGYGEKYMIPNLFPSVQNLLSLSYFQIKVIYPDILEHVAQYVTCQQVLGSHGSQL